MISGDDKVTTRLPLQLHVITSISQGILPHRILYHAYLNIVSCFQQYVYSIRES